MSGISKNTFHIHSMNDNLNIGNGYQHYSTVGSISSVKITFLATLIIINY